MFKRQKLYICYGDLGTSGVNKGHLGDVAQFRHTLLILAVPSSKGCHLECWTSQHTTKPRLAQSYFGVFA